MLEWHVVSLIKVPNIYIYQHPQQFALKYEKGQFGGKMLKSIVFSNSFQWNPERVTYGVRFKDLLFQTIFVFNFKVPYMCVMCLFSIQTSCVCTTYVLRCQMPQSILSHFVNPYVNLVLIYYITYLALAVPVALWGHEIHDRNQKEFFRQFDGPIVQLAVPVPNK